MTGSLLSAKPIRLRPSQLSRRPGRRYRRKISKILHGPRLAETGMERPRKPIIMDSGTSRAVAVALALVGAAALVGTGTLTGCGSSNTAGPDSGPAQDGSTTAD